MKLLYQFPSLVFNPPFAALALMRGFWQNRGTMKTCKTFLAADLGAGSGRVMAARYDGSTLSLEAAHRFDNVPVSVGGHLHWNLLSLYAGVRDGIAAALRDYGPAESVGVDTWGVDYGLLDGSGRLLGLPYAYRDVRNDGMADKVCARLGRRRVYDRTGIQFIDFNTLFQLQAEADERDSLLGKASRLLFTPDLVNYWLSGVAANEATIASTGQCIDLATRDWAYDLLEAVGAPRALFGEIVRPGTVLGAVTDGAGAGALKVVAVGSHDTASAVAATPLPRIGAWGYLATGTWALMGVEINDPILTDRAYELSYTHEGGVTGEFRFLKNITGMWIYQELRREWKEAGDVISFDDLTALAVKAAPFVSLIDPDAPDFQKPGQMAEKIAAYCARTGQPVPQDKGAFARCALESMVLRYREVWTQLEELTGVKRDGLNMIGGATRNALHCQMTADALGIPVLCGPAEGAAAGNVLLQLIAAGELKSLAEGRELIARSDPPAEYRPDAAAAARWDDAYARWLKIKAM